MVKESPQEPTPAEPQGPPSGQDRHPIVGIGASAGGLEALQAFFQNVPDQCGASFVIVQHLDPHHPSILRELLARNTSLPIEQAADGTVAAPDHAYVIPPNALMTIEAGVLRVHTPMAATRMPIDVFFRSLAEDLGDLAICVVLSGTGTDGALGLKAVKEHGGMTMAQAVASARYDSMPRSAIALGLVDYILSAEALPAKLLDYLAHLEKVRSARAEQRWDAETTEAALRRIYPLLQRKTGHDFSSYKRSTIIRRIQRRMQVLQLESLTEYVAHLSTIPSEVELLFQDLLIGVTQFFRDPEVFAALTEKVLPTLDKGSEGQVRIWVPGCATGEEAYSIAMLLRETVQIDGGPQIKIFATDIDERALAVARAGIYPDSIAEHVSSERLERFFHQRVGGYQVSKEIREMCIFSLHNLISEPPFSRLDLISCRNLFIYLESELQKSIFPLFHFALNSNGYLLLGPSENITAAADLFKTIDKAHRIFQRREAVVSVAFPLSLPHLGARLSPEGQRRPPGREQDLTKLFEHILLQRYAPGSVIANANGDIVFVSGRTAKYLELPSGLTSVNVLEMAHRQVRPELHRALREAARTRQEVVQAGLSVEVDDQVQPINLIVRPLTELGQDSELVMIIFQEVGPPVSREQARATSITLQGSDTLAQALEEELRNTKEHLQTTIEELETSNEELKSTNEELLSTNEELQSANEEMQTSREELQSVNEELHTVNSELSRKLEELDKVNSDLQNLFASTQIATLFLDNRLLIQKFSPAASDVFRLIDGDVGRPISDITAVVDNGDLEVEIRAVLRDLTPAERQVRRTDADIWYLRRIRPYRSVENTIDGVVITYVDITELKQAQVRSSLYAAIVESSHDAIVGLTLDGAITAWNRGAERMFGGPAQERVGRVLAPLMFEDWPEGLDPFWQHVRRGERVEPFEATYVRPDGHRLRLVLSISPVRSHRGELLGISLIVHDITERERARAALQKSEERFRRVSESAVISIAFFEETGRISEANETFLRMLGYSADDLRVGRIHWEGLIAPDWRAQGAEIFAEIKARNSCPPREIQLLRLNGARFWALLGGAMLQGGAEGVALIVDITERKRAEEMLLEGDRRKNDFLAILAHELRNPLAPIRSAVEVLQHSRPADGPLARAQQMIDRQVRLLTRLIDDLLDVSRIARGKILLRRERVDLCKVVRTTIEDYESEAKAAGLSIELDLPGPGEVWLLADATRLSQCVANLLGNAIKFTDAGGRIFVAVEVENGGRRALVRVRDTGSGMTHEVLERAFEPFSQGEHSLTRGRGGLGLGLPLVKGLIELHGGQIEAHSEGPGRGSEFVLHLPLLDHAGKAAVSLEAAPQRAPRRRVLLIEDNVDAADALRMVLEMRGHEVIIAHRGQEGVDQARSLRPDVVVCDIGLPDGLDGFGVARALRTDPVTAPIYLVALTGFGSEEDRRHTHEAGFDQHLTKPINGQDIDRLLAQLPQQGEVEPSERSEPTPSM